MKFIVSLLVFTLFFIFANISSAAEAANAREIKRSQIDKIKITSSQPDSFLFFLFDKRDVVYRISSLTQKQAQEILNRLKGESTLSISTQSVDEKNYLEVTNWQ